MKVTTHELIFVPSMEIGPNKWEIVLGFYTEPGLAMEHLQQLIVERNAGRKTVQWTAPGWSWIEEQGLWERGYILGDNPMEFYVRIEAVGRAPEG